MARKKLLHIKSTSVVNGAPKLPTANQIEYGEIAVNYGDGVETLSIKNSADEIVTFTNDETLIAYIDEQDNELATAAGLSTTAGTGPDTGVTNFEYVADEDDYYLSAATSLFNADQILSQAVLENERVTAEALNDLNTRVKKVSGTVTTVQSNLDSLSQRTDAAIDDIYDTIENLDAIDVDDTLNKSEVTEGDKTKYVLGVKIDNALDLTSKYPVANSAISTVIKEDEEVIAAALNDLNTRVGEVSGSVSSIESITDGISDDLDYLSGQIDTNTASITGLGQSKQDKLTAGTGIDITENVISCTLDTQISEFVSELPTTGNTNKIYFVPSADTGATSGNTYIEYAWHVTGATQADGEWEKLGEWAPSLTIDDELDLDSVNPVQNAAISSAMTRIEFVTSSALNDLNTRTTEISGNVSTISGDVETLKTRVANTYTKPEVDAMVDDLEITIDDTLNSGSTNPLANSAITANFDRVEKVTAASLNDLNNKALELSADTTSLKATVSGIQDEIDSLSPEYVVNGKTGTTDNPIWLGASDIKLSRYTSPANNTDEDPILSGDTVNQAFSKVISAITDNEEVTSAALNDLDARITTVSGDLQTVSEDLQTLIDNPVEPMVAVTYSELVALKSGGELAAGSWYRITDYQCTTTQATTSAATHNFDIIVLALSNNTLSEEARAIQHEGDTYFANSKLSAWKVWYCLENDTTRFLWADTTNGKGVVYRLIDEFNNDIKYDFKNILFTRNLTDGAYDSGGTATWCYTLNVWHENACKDASVVGNTLVNDENAIVGVYSNNFGYINCYTTGTNKTSFVFCLGNNVVLSIDEGDEYYGIRNNMIGDDSFRNTFGGYCNNNTFGNYCYNNTFGNSCDNNTFGNYCTYNAFAVSCNSNTFGNSCSNNTFGNNCHNNTFWNNCSSNTFENSCDDNTFGNNCVGNTFGNDCYSNTLGDYCSNNTFGGSCDNNTFGNGCENNMFGTGTTTINYVRYIKVENGVNYANITTTATTSSSAYLQNITISQGVSGTRSSRKTISHPTVGDAFQTIYRPANSQIVSV